YNQQFNLGIQKRFGGTLVEASGIGALARDIPVEAQQINEVRPEVRAALAAGALPGINTQVLRPFPQFGSISMDGEATGTTNFYGALIDVKRNFAKGLTFESNYMHSVVKTNTIWRGYYGRDHGPGGGARPHRFVFSGVYELPWGPGKKFLSSGVLGKIA